MKFEDKAQELVDTWIDEVGVSSCFRLHSASPDIAKILGRAKDEELLAELEGLRHGDDKNIEYAEGDIKRLVDILVHLDRRIATIKARLGAGE